MLHARLAHHLRVPERAQRVNPLALHLFAPLSELQLRLCGMQKLSGEEIARADDLAQQSHRDAAIAQMQPVTHSHHATSLHWPQR